MKFAREFQDSLNKGEYPQPWLDTAISYRKLKKCIKKVQVELQSLGLDRHALEHLLEQTQAGSNDSMPGQDDGSGTHKTSLKTLDFMPTVTIALDPRDGSPLDAWLGSETRRHLQRLVARRKSQVQPDSGVSPAEPRNGNQALSAETVQSSERAQELNGSTDNGEQVETVDIPLTGENEFFLILKRELAQLDRLQEAEQQRLKSEIVELGHELAGLKLSKSKKSKAVLEAWREIFRLYIESEIFFSSHEQDAGVRDSTHAQNQLQTFNKTLTSEMGREVKLDPTAKAALDRFLDINLELLKFIKFQEVNLKATAKILKKFNKQTALHSQLIDVKALNTGPLVTRNLAKDTCYTISQELLHIFPQLDDYLCPICFSITYKPIRLRCNHVFCIRCLIVMQREDQTDCPLCREKVVMEADIGTEYESILCLHS